MVGFDVAAVEVEGAGDNLAVGEGDVEHVVGIDDPLGVDPIEELVGGVAGHAVLEAVCLQLIRV